jgi:glutathione synthase/RimK-type ligase-like ATP-grasp enzyme
MVVTSHRELKAAYADLGPGDVFIGILSWKHLQQSVLIDFLERGIHCLPSPLSQILSSSKVAQAFLLKDWMLPQTLVVTRRADLMSALNRYHEHGIGAVVSKQDHMHCGHGIRRWDNIETLYSFMALSKSSYPFVLQPFAEDCADLRVIIVGDYVECYVRHNPYNFRVNISSGGASHPSNLQADKERFCRSVMERGKFPFAHIDLLVGNTGEYYLSEIALNGGTRGAQIAGKELNRKKRYQLAKMAEHLADGIRI